MSGVLNNTARQYNLKTIGKNKNRVTVRIAPGFNVVDDDHWKEFTNDPYVKSLKKDKILDYGKAQDDQELERDPDTVSKSKSVPPPAPPKES